jgi:UDP-N-acetylglucosamine diphosphorylase/glucosamine-1-phosphate N-acetyltransferase
VNPTLVLFDDGVAADWMPFALTRPIADLLFGAFSFAARSESITGLPCRRVIARSALAGFDEADCHPVVDAADATDSAAQLFLCSRVVLDWSAHFEPTAEPTLVRVGGQTAGWWAPAGTPPPPRAFFDQPAHASPPAQAEVDLPGRLVANIWELVSRNAEQLARDWVGTARRSGGQPASRFQTSGSRVEVSDAPLGPVVTGGPGRMSPAVPLPYEVIGGDPKLVRVNPRNIVIEPYVLFDVSAGPIWIQEGVTIRASTRLAGPAFIGHSTTLLGGSISGVSIGPQCKVRGEVEASVILGYANKAHDGFLGHAYLGRWVNLGALTTNSDLKNNYGSVRVRTPAGDVDTGEMKVGCFLGDHVKTAIGTMLSTGTVVGAGANIFGDRAPARFVPPFAWGSDGVYDVERFLGTAEIAMRRRGVTLTPGLREVLRRAWNAQHGKRTATLP